MLIALTAVLAICTAASSPASRTGSKATAGQEAWGQADAEYTLMVPGTAGEAVFFEARRSGQARLLLLGLRHGGAVSILVNGARPAAAELLARRGPARNSADSALVTAAVVAGRNRVQVTETDGAQVVRIIGTNRWFAASTQAAGQAAFTVDLDHMCHLHKEYPVQVNYGPRGEGFLWFSAKWDRYYGEVYASSVSRVRGSSGPNSATLSFVLEYPARHLVMPTQLTLVPELSSGAFAIRVRQALRATDPTSLDDGTEFLHVKITGDGAVDWQDGITDYAWYRSQSGDCPDAPTGSHTGMVRMDDNTLRVYAYRSSTSDPTKTTVSSPHHTGAAVPLEAVNTIGGFLSKTGVGCCAWVFHQYRTNFRSDVTPVFGHCGDGADTHFFASCLELYCPLPMGPGHVLETEYSLTMLPSEVTREEIEDLNEADLYLFGTEKEQGAPITAWIGTRSAIGLLRGDGSLILLGLGQDTARVPIPEQTVRRAANAYRLFGLLEPTCEHLDLAGATVEVRPGWVTVVDCGAALWDVVPTLGAANSDAPAGEGDRMEHEEEDAVTQPGEEGSGWSRPLISVPLDVTLRRK